MGSKVDQKSNVAPAVDDQQFEERLRIAERIAKALRGAGYSCELGDERSGAPSKLDH